MAAGMKRLFTALLIGAMSNLPAWAESDLVDPTRPAFELVPGLDGQPVETKAAPSTPSGLQSVILSGKREAAIINGVEVEVGQKYGNATLTVVNETCVVLMGPEGRQVMQMYPSVNLSKTEQACTGRRGLPTIRKAAVQNKPKQKPARAKKKTVTCVDEDTKDGSGK